MASDFHGMHVAVFVARHPEKMKTLVSRHAGAPAVVSTPETDGSGTIRSILNGEVDVALFTHAAGVEVLVRAARHAGVEQPLRDAFRRIAIASIDPACTEALRAHRLSVEFEPDRMTAEALVRGMARLSRHLVMKKRAAADAGVDTSRWQRTDMVWPAKTRYAEAEDSPFMRACRRAPAPYTPVWLLRQAGRYQRAYRAIKEKVGFLDMCRTPELTAEITLMATERLDVDAAIIFADILPILQPMGFELEFIKGTGPVIHNPLRAGKGVERLADVDPEALSFVYASIRLARRALPPALPLIGFSGAPFTLAAYAIEGGASKNYEKTKTFMYRDPGAWHAFMKKLARAVAGYLDAQVEAGVQAVQLFDSWVGCLSPDDYRRFVLPHTRFVFSHLPPGVPAIHFGTGTAALLASMREAGGDVLGLDWRVDLAEAWRRLGRDVAVQGNLDPVVLLGPPAEIRRRARAILRKAEGRPGHIFNLGHGVLPGTPEDHVTVLVDAVHEYGK